MDIHVKSADMDMDAKFHIHGKLTYMMHIRLFIVTY